MSITTTGNINSSGQLLQIWLQKTVLENFEPEMYFYRMGEKPTVPDGYSTISWTRPSRLTLEPDDAELDEGITPDEQAFTFETVSVTGTQFGLYVTLSDKLLRRDPIGMISKASIEVGRNLARIIDTKIQSVLLADNTVTIYCSTDHSTRNTLDTTDLMTAGYLAKAYTRLQVNSAPTYDGYYLAQMHPNVAYDLKTETGTGNWLEINKYVTPDKLFKGEIGAIGGIRVLVNPFVRPIASSTTVYPTYVMGRNAYGVADWQTMQTYITPLTASDSDPLAQRSKVGAKVDFGTILLQQDSLLIMEAGSTLTYASDVNPIP